ncbi:YciI family protein [Rhizobium mesosinicum]|uniref:YciI family protein n=1 Tax=Rhizobium mesosinicum TaxID=335017 RepID=A0ABS7GVQ6_9HYPH|nr:YciI family protein [Rhizobium mesosinicum]MBW9053851.1 YciI family protein [Rhizobium mesosinicum]
MQYALIIRESAEDFVVRRNDPAYRDGWTAYTKALVQAGILTAGAGLTSPETGTILRRKGENHDVQDGPYPEGKESLGGFYVIDVPDLDTALAWATRVPVSEQGSVEIRPRLQVA